MSEVLSMKKVRIGIVASRFLKKEPAFANEELTYTMQGNVAAVIESGALPILIPITDPGDATQYLSQVDGLILPGGQDVQPKLYGEPESDLLGVTSASRDSFELKLIEIAIQQKKPIFAICRGAQLVNVYFGGTLYQDESLIKGKVRIEHDQTRLAIKNEIPSHMIKIVDEELQSVLGNSTKVNSLHHQAIKKIGKGLTITAVAADGVVEAFKNDSQKITAYQWHPEMQQRSDARMLQLFKIFLQKNFTETS